MIRRGQRTSFQERLEIIERAKAGQSDPEIAAALGCSVWTVRKWRRSGQRQGRSGLTSQMGRPPNGPLSTFPSALRDAIVQLRRTHPGWGPDTILAELRVDPCWTDQPLPSRSRVAALLKAATLTRRYQRHSELPEAKPALEGTPHDEWELDAQGAMHVAGVGTVSLITILDVVSRLKIESYPCQGTTRPALPDYQLALRRAFLTYGLPQQMTLDRDTVFFDNTTPSPFPTRLHLWLVALGIAVCFTRVRRPTDHAKIERTHQTMTLQALLGQQWPDQTALWAGLDARRAMLNQHIPCRALQGRAPLAAYPEAKHSGRSYRPEWEVELLDLNRVYQYLTTGRWFRQVKPNGRFAIGGYEYYVGTNLGGRMLELRFDAEQGVFVAQAEGSETSIRLAPQGLTKADLMGELVDLLTLPAYQLALPFTYHAWRQLAYARTLAAAPSAAAGAVA
jgi:transposase InsO family protein